MKAEERLNDPWTRGLVIAPSVQNSMVTTTFGVPDFRALTPFMQKPASSVMMTFTGDPHLGMTHDEFSGSAVGVPGNRDVRDEDRRAAAVTIPLKRPPAGL